MINKQILQKAIEKAVENGWYTEFLDEEWKVSSGDGMPTVFWGDKFFCGGTNIIFSHSFAKSFWGTGVMYIRENADPVYVWQFHLRQLAISEDRLKYLEQFL